MARALGFAFIVAAIVIATLVVGGVRAASLPEVWIADTDPPLTQNLNRGTVLYLHLRYRSEAPLRAQVKGFFEGAEVVDGASWNPSPPYPAGEGEVIAWIAYSKPTRLDELRVEVSDGKWQPVLILKQPANVAWTGLVADEPTRAEWVKRLSDAQQDATRQGIETIGNDSFGNLIGFLVMISVPGYFVLQILFGLRWSGWWRIAALVPLVFMAPALGHAVFALSAGSNIWPIVLILAAPFGFLYLVIAAGVKYMGGMRQATA
jgi:hypothetical protein